MDYKLFNFPDYKTFLLIQFYGGNIVCYLVKFTSGKNFKTSLVYTRRYLGVRFRKVCTKEPPPFPFSFVKAIQIFSFYFFYLLTF